MKNQFNDIDKILEIMDSIISLIFICDISNITCFEFLDTTLPINFLAWTLYLLWYFYPALKCKYKNIQSKDFKQGEKND